MTLRQELANGAILNNATNDIIEAACRLDDAQNELDAARANVHYDAKQGREIGLWRLAVAESKWDQADAHYQEVADHTAR